MKDRVKSLQGRVEALEELLQPKALGGAKQEELLEPKNQSGTIVPLRDQLSVAVKAAAKSTRGSRLPENWEPHTDTILKMSKELNASVNALRRAHLKFMDHFLSAPGAKGVKLDWDRTWCNWMRTESERGTLMFLMSRPGSTGTVADKAQGWMELGNAGSN